MAKKSSFFKNYNYRQTLQYYQDQEEDKGSWYVKILIFLTTLLLLTFFFSVHFDFETSQSLEYKTIPGYMWTGPKIVADYNFPIFKNYNEYQSEVNKAKKQTPKAFAYDKDAKNKCLKKLQKIYANLSLMCKDTVEINTDEIEESIIDEFRKIKDKNCETNVKKIYYNLAAFMKKVYKYGFIDVSLSSIEQQEIAAHFNPNVKKYYKKETLTDLNKLNSEAKDYLSNIVSEEAMPTALEIVNHLSFPNLHFSSELTDKAKEAAAKSVPRHEGIVRKGEVIVAKGQVVSEEILKKLSSYEKSKLLKSDVVYSFWSFLGGFLHSGIIYGLLLIYLFFIRKRIFSDNFQLSLLSSLLVLSGFLSWLSITIPSDLPIELGIFIPAFAMLAAIVFDSRTAFYTTVTMALLVSGIRGTDYSSGLILLFAGAMAAYTVRDIQNRTQMFQSIFYVFIGFLIGIAAFSLERTAEISSSLNQIMIAGLNAVVSPLLTFGALLLLERYSNITTDLRLQEFDKQNHPLLNKLSEVATGTYQHTLAIAHLAERCAGAIGANPLLAKVGALYHDIGKLSKPEYFVENQIETENKHNLLTPQKSAEAIKRHVTEGIKLAHEYNLPQRIIDFIPTHHGTTLIKHFYATALEQAEDQNEVKEKDFRYPGPKPSSKETAIVMICDFSEAISRLVGNNKEKLEKEIDKNIRERLLDGQFDEGDLTLKDLKIIKGACVKSLLGSSHKRVEYKEAPQKPDSGNAD